MIAFDFGVCEMKLRIEPQLIEMQDSQPLSIPDILSPGDQEAF
jgi:hypothetical protein